MMRVAVIGAGLAALACARTLLEHGVDVTIFDKGRSVGGRLATRRVPPHTFDLGAQYFTARDERFGREVGAWLDRGVCAPWRGRIVALDPARGTARAVDPIARLVGTPDMSALGRHLATGLSVWSGHRVDRIARQGGELTLRGTVAPPGVTLRPAEGDEIARDDLGSYDCVVLCMPAGQAAPLVQVVSPRLAQAARDVPLEPCLALGLAASPGDEPSLHALGFDGAFVGREGERTGSPLAWVARDSSKPARPPGERWVLHASAAWSRAWWDSPEDSVTSAMLADFARLVGVGPLSPAVTVVQRWLFARAPAPLDGGALFDEQASLGLGGDWTSGGRVEGAFLSGITLASRVLLAPSPARAAAARGPRAAPPRAR